MRSIRLPSWTERLLGLEPQPVPPHVFALDGRHLRYGGFSASADALSFDTYRLVELPVDLFVDGPLGGPVSDPAHLNEIVGDFLGGLGVNVREANLVVPDAWMRLLFTEVEELPAKTAQQEEIVRFKLRRLVPFRIEELRIAWHQVSALPDQEAPIRVLVGFAIDSLMSELEGAFAAHGVYLGQVTNGSLATLAALSRRVPPDDLAALVMVEDGTYTIAYLRRGEPVLYRYKFLGELPENARDAVIRRDLHLTRTFVESNLPDTQLTRLVLATEPSVDPMTWSAWLEDELGVRAEPIGMEHLPLSRARTDLPWLETAILTGGAAVEVT